MKKIIISLISLLVLTSQVYALPIYEYKYEEELYNGITHTSYMRLYKDKNLKFDVIKADLNKDYLTFELFKSSEGSDTLDTVKNLANTKESTLVASNADFFSVHKGNKGFSLGIEISDSKLLQSPINTDEMAGAFLQENELTLSYFNFNKKIIAPNGESATIRHTNKHTSYYGDLLLYTSDFNNGMSPAPGGEVVEMVVSDNKVVEFRRNMPPAKIPENGYVLVVSEGVSMFLANNFKEDDEVIIEIDASYDTEKTSTAFGGGTLLIKDGVTAPITHEVAGNNPRTAIGTDKTGKIIYIVTVDGRQNLSKGVTLPELAEIMLELGCYNAMNLDGGGSTNLVAKTPFNSEIHSINSPTENRKVINAVGITTSAYPSSPASVKLNLTDDTVFIDDSLSLEARIFDKYLNPVWNNEEVTITASSGKIGNNIYYPSRGGTATITAKYKSFKDTKTINIIDEVATIKLNKTLELDPGKSSSLDISVIDDKGNLCKVNNFTNFKISSLSPQTISYSNKKINALKTGVGYIKVEYKDVVSYLKVIVGNPGISPYYDNFEVINATSTSYPDEYAVAQYEISNEQASSGQTSGKLSYDFTTEDYNDTMAAYIVFNSVRITDRAKSISFDVFSEEAIENLQIKLQFTDGKGNEAYRLVASDSLHEGWQNIEVIIPETAKWPLSLTRLYVVQEETDEKRKGSLYFDNLKVNTSYNEEITIIDEVNTSKDSQLDDDLTIKFAGVPDSPTTILDKITYRNLLNEINDADIYGVIGKYNYEDSHGENTPIATSESDAFSKYGCTFVNILTEKESIRAYSPDQWDIIKKATSTNDPNIFILINGSIDPDSFEITTLIDLMKSTKKLVYIITNSQQNSLFKYDNVHFFQISDTADGVNLNDKLSCATVLQFNLKDEIITYEFKKLWN